ncbi:unnamed protein product [Calicophoron daubneyi]|uniref:Uncharacterized protein n=1 Tax=Calicophoron daubneyi TaxID=300641 RepID=A0AAV2TNL1_CALDB
MELTVERCKQLPNMARLKSEKNLSDKDGMDRMKGKDNSEEIVNRLAKDLGDLKIIQRGIYESGVQCGNKFFKSDRLHNQFEISGWSPNSTYLPSQKICHELQTPVPQYYDTPDEYSVVGQLNKPPTQNSTQNGGLPLRRRYPTGGNAPLTALQQMAARRRGQDRPVSQLTQSPPYMPNAGLSAAVSESPIPVDSRRCWPAVDQVPTCADLASLSYDALNEASVQVRQSSQVKTVSSNHLPDEFTSDSLNVSDQSKQYTTTNDVMGQYTPADSGHYSLSTPSQLTDYNSVDTPALSSSSSDHLSFGAEYWNSTQNGGLPLRRRYPTGGNASLTALQQMAARRRGQDRPVSQLTQSSSEEPEEYHEVIEKVATELLNLNPPTNEFTSDSLNVSDRSKQYTTTNDVMGQYTPADSGHYSLSTPSQLTDYNSGDTPALSSSSSDHLSFGAEYCDYPEEHTHLKKESRKRSKELADVTSFRPHTMQMEEFLSAKSEFASATPEKLRKAIFDLIRMSSPGAKDERSRQLAFSRLGGLVSALLSQQPGRIWGLKDWKDTNGKDVLELSIELGNVNAVELLLKEGLCGLTCKVDNPMDTYASDILIQVLLNAPCPFETPLRTSQQDLLNSHPDQVTYLYTQQDKIKPDTLEIHTQSDGLTNEQMVALALLNHLDTTLAGTPQYRVIINGKDISTQSAQDRPTLMHRLLDEHSQEKCLTWSMRQLLSKGADILSSARHIDPAGRYKSQTLNCLQRAALSFDADHILPMFLRSFFTSNNELRNDIPKDAIIRALEQKFILLNRQNDLVHHLQSGFISIDRHTEQLCLKLINRIRGTLL